MISLSRCIWLTDNIAKDISTFIIVGEIEVIRQDMIYR